MRQPMPPSLARRVASLRHSATPTLRVDEALDRLAGPSSPLALLVLGTAAWVPSPGVPLGMAAGLLAVPVATHLLVHGERRVPRVPDRLGRQRLSRPLLDAVARRAVPVLRRLERMARPRWPIFATGVGARLAALMALVQAIVVALPIPFGNTLPGFSIAVMGLALARRDGALTIASHALGLLGIGIATALALATYAGIRWLV
ncbi:MAG: exopolysaccharide biosynthesis protein [Pseudomonadota bacterium]